MEKIIWRELSAGCWIGYIGGLKPVSKSVLIYAEKLTVSIRCDVSLKKKCVMKTTIMDNALPLVIVFSTELVFWLKPDKNE